MKPQIHWLGHDAFRIEGDGKVVYIDPYQTAGGPAADLILITHDHFDHCSPADAARVSGPDTTIVTVKGAAAGLSGRISVVKPGDRLTLQGVPIEVVPAYNTNKFRGPGKVFHPRSAGYAGFIVTLAGKRVYHAGDTDRIPEMDGLRVDIALLPVSGTYVMTVDEALEAAAALKPELAVPMHVGAGIGDLSQAQDFAARASVPAQVLPLER